MTPRPRYVVRKSSMPESTSILATVLRKVSSNIMVWERPTGRNRVPPPTAGIPIESLRSRLGVLLAERGNMRNRHAFWSEPATPPQEPAFAQRLGVTRNWQATGSRGRVLSSMPCIYSRGFIRFGQPATTLLHAGCRRSDDGMARRRCASSPPTPRPSTFLGGLWRSGARRKRSSRFDGRLLFFVARETHTNYAWACFSAETLNRAGRSTKWRRSCPAQYSSDPAALGGFKPVRRTLFLSARGPGKRHPWSHANSFSARSRARLPSNAMPI